MAIPRFDQRMKTTSREQLWQEYCGFLDMSLSDYMYTQRRLMEEQMKLWYACPLGRQLLAGFSQEELAQLKTLFDKMMANGERLAGKEERK